MPATLQNTPNAPTVQIPAGGVLQNIHANRPPSTMMFGEEFQGPQIEAGKDTWHMLSGSPTFDMSPQGGSAAIRFRVMGGFAMAKQIVEELLGGPYIKPNNILARKLPASLWSWYNTALDDEIEFLFCTKAALKPFAGDTGQETEFPFNKPQCAYKEWTIDTVWQTLPYSVKFAVDCQPIPGLPREAQRYFFREVNPGGQFINIERGEWVLDDPTVSIDKRPVITSEGIWRAQSEVIFTLYDIPRTWFKLSVIESLEGKCNQGPDKFLNEYEPETLLFLNCTPQPTKSPFGLPMYNLRFRCLYRSQGVNKALSPNTVGGEFVYRDIVNRSNAARKLIVPGDFTRWFTMDVPGAD